MRTTTTMEQAMIASQWDRVFSSPGCALMTPSRSVGRQGQSFVRASTGGGDDVVVDLGGELVDGPRDVGVRVELLLRRLEVVVGLGLLEGCLAVLADHHEGRQEDRFQRHDERKRRPGALLEDEHPQREEGDMQVDEVHRAGECRDLVGDSQLEVLSALHLVLENKRTMLRLRLLGVSHVVASFGAVGPSNQPGRIPPREAYSGPRLAGYP